MKKRDFFDVMIEKLAEGLNDMEAELKRLGNHGRTELASALFGNSGFVLYGADQRTGKAEANKSVHGPELQKPEPDQGQERERGGLEM